MSKKKGSTTLVDLSAQQLRHLLRPRDGAMPYVLEMFELYAKDPVGLRVKGIDLTALKEELAIIDALSPQVSATERSLEQQRQNLLLHQSSVYRAALLIYERAQSAATTDGDMAHAIAGFAAFLKPKRVSRKKAVPASPTTP